MDFSTPGFPVLHYLPEFAQTHVHWVDDAIQPSVTSLSCLYLSRIRVFSNESALWIRWPKHWCFSFSVSSMNIQGWFPLGWTGLIQGTLKSLLQHHNLKASVLWCSAFFMVQLSHPYMTTRKAMALTRWTFVSKVISLLFNMLSRFVIAFLSSKEKVSLIEVKK